MTPKVPPASRFRLPGFLEIAILVLFFLSGASALVYEVVWSRSLTNIFGGSAFAVATVLAAFMGGLALGSTVFGRFIDRRGHPLVVYGVLEAGIAVWALILPFLLILLNQVFAGIYQTLDPGFYALSLIRFSLTFLLLLIPTTMMGGTLPVLGKLLLRDRKRLGQRAGILYGANTLGAVLGVAAGGFLLLPSLGLQGSTFLAAAVNLAVAGLAILLARKFPSIPSETDEEAPSTETKSAATLSVGRPALHRTVLIVYAASGFAALAYEVAWTKTLSMVLGNTTYAFTAMLTTFLLGLSLGALIFSRLADRYKRPDALLAMVQIGIPVSALAMIPVFEKLPQLFVNGFQQFSGSWGELEFYRFLLAAMTLILPTLLMGGTFPLVTRIYVQGGKTGKQLGTLYAANTIGAIFGSFLAGFVLIPWLGRQDSILAATLVNLAAAGLLIAVIQWRGISRIARLAVAGLVVLLIPAVLLGVRPWNPKVMASGAYVYAPHVGGNSIPEFMAQNNLLFYDEGTEATVSVWNTEFMFSLRTNGKIEASSHGDMVTQKMISHLPAMYHGGQPEEALMIGLASGISVGALLTHPLKHVETIELIPAMEDAARFFDAYNYHCLDDPRHELIMNDGRNHLLLSDKKYDIIISEPPNPWVAGVTSLFTREFFELTKDRLNPGGVVCQWVQTYQLSETDLKTVLATFADAYAYMHVWRGGPGDLIVVASMDPLLLDVDKVNKAIAGRPGEDMAHLEILPLPHILSLFVSNKEGVLPFIGWWSKRVTDDNLYLEYTVPRYMLRGGDEIKSDILRAMTTPLMPHLTGNIYPALETEIDNYRQAREMAFQVRAKQIPAGATSLSHGLEMALTLAPGELVSKTFLGHAINEEAIQHVVNDETSLAIPRFRYAVARGTRQERALALNNLGAIAFGAGDVDSAMYFWNAADEQEPFYSIVTLNLAMASTAIGDTSQAIVYLKRSLALQPDNAEITNNLAYYLAATNMDLEEAEKYARRAVAIDPLPINQDTLGYVLLRLQKWSEAKKILKKILDKNPGAMESLLHLGMAQAGGGDSEEARRSFETVLRQAPNTAFATRAQRELGKL